MSVKIVHQCDRCGIWSTEVATLHGKILCPTCFGAVLKADERAQRNAFKKEEDT
ncbi:MAG: hypothetical protein ACYDBP_04700 [Leptospirales bacterium]